MAAETVRWGIVATVAEPLPLVQTFVAHHLSLGASEIYLYFDYPRDPGIDAFGHLPQVKVTRCDREYWNTTLQSGRAPRHNNRQSLNAEHAQARANVDFLLHCDADEFLTPTSQPAPELALMPSQISWYKVFNSERCRVIGRPHQTIFDGPMKRMDHSKRSVPYRVTSKTPHGFTGHAAGKSFVRVADRLKISIHVPRKRVRAGVQARTIPPHKTALQMHLMHFDGLTPLHWAAKFIRQAATFNTKLLEQPPWRLAQARACFKALDRPGGLLELYETVNGYTEDEVRRFIGRGYMFDPKLDFAPALARYFPGQTIDLSPEAFDALLQPKVNRWLKQARRAGAID